MCVYLTPSQPFTCYCDIRLLLQILSSVLNRWPPYKVYRINIKGLAAKECKKKAHVYMRVLLASNNVVGIRYQQHR